MEEGKCKGRPSAAPLSRHLPRFPAPQHVPPHSLEPTGGPGSPFLPGRPGPSPPVTAPGSPCRDREQRAGFWQREPRGGRSPDRRPSYSSRCRRPCGVWPAAPLLPPAPSTYRLPLWALRSSLSLRTKQSKGRCSVSGESKGGPPWANSAPPPRGPTPGRCWGSRGGAPNSPALHAGQAPLGSPVTGSQSQDSRTTPPLKQSVPPRDPQGPGSLTFGPGGPGRPGSPGSPSAPGRP